MAASVLNSARAVRVFEVIFQAMRELMTPPAGSRKRIGFRPEK
jgi:hypothetical protein